MHTGDTQSEEAEAQQRAASTAAAAAAAAAAAQRQSKHEQERAGKVDSIISSVLRQHGTVPALVIQATSGSPSN
jgi:hypothetical protein